MVARPIEQVLDEVEQAVVGPVKILEDEHDGRRSAMRSKKRRHAEKRSSLSPARSAPRGRAGARGAARGTRARRRRRRARERLAQLRERRLGRSSSATRARTHHLRKRPVRDAVAVGEAAAAVPAHVVGEPVDVLLELPERRDLPIRRCRRSETSRARRSSRRRGKLLDSRNSRSRPTNGGCTLTSGPLRAARRSHAARDGAGRARSCLSTGGSRSPRRRSQPRSPDASRRRRGPCRARRPD